MEKPLSPAPSRVPIYSFSWSASVVERARKSYARAWQILDGILGLSERQLAFLIACNAPEWAQIRTLTHTIDRWLRQQERCNPGVTMSTIQLLSNLLRIHKNSLGVSLYQYLTDKLAALILEEQVKEGQGGATAPTCLPFLGGSGGS